MKRSRDSELHGQSLSITSKELVSSLLAAFAADKETEVKPQDVLGSSPPPSSSPLPTIPSIFIEPMIVTFCRDLDGLLGGGFRIGDVTEIVGLPGTGKTQLLMQLCLNVQLHSLLGGCGGEALIIDAEGAVSVERLSQMAEAMYSHVRKITRRFPDSERPPIRAVASTTALLSGVHIAKAYNFSDFTATIASLYEFLSKNPKVRLVCIDSIACHLRYGPLAASSNPRPRTGMLLQLAQSLNEIAERFNVAIIASNHMTTKFLKGNAHGKSFSIMGSNIKSRIEPALGELWSSACTRRIKLSFETNPNSGIRAGNRLATVEKEPIRYRDCAKVLDTPQMPPPRSAYFIISSEGIRGIPPPPRKQVVLQEQA
jgi:RecA/RadA recombinase